MQIFKCVKTSTSIATAMTAGLLSTLVVAAIPPKSASLPKSVNGGEAEFRKEIQPLLKKYCYACHAGGVKSGSVAFDEIKSDPSLLENRKLFQRVLKNLRSGIMPPVGADQPSEAEKRTIEEWIKAHVYQIDPVNPDPGRVTVRRLNRVEYANTIHDLIGIDYDTRTEFPADDAGHGFDNIGDVLTLSPMLMEKYLDAAQSIVSKAVPTASKVIAETEILGASFQREGAQIASNKAANVPTGNAANFLALSYYEPATVSHALQIEHPGSYQLILDLSANERYVDNQVDYNRCRLVVKTDGQELLRKEFNREGGKRLHYEFDQKWQTGAHSLSFELQPLTPGVEQIRSLTLRINKVTVRGPLITKAADRASVKEGSAKTADYRVEPRNYRRFFPEPVPSAPAQRHIYAHKLIGDFARRAFRRPVDEKSVARLVALAEGVSAQPGQTFEGGIAQAMVAVLASPRFLFREEGIATAKNNQQSRRKINQKSGLSKNENHNHHNNQPYPLIDEYALASRLSYLLWSSMPDEELFRLAGQGQLRKNLTVQVQRMLSDRRSEALVQNFSGQWLQTRDIEKVPIDARAVLSREAAPIAFTPGSGDRNRRGPRIRFDDALRKDLRHEADSYFGYVVHEDRSVLELIDSNYTFLNARLAQYYGLNNSGVTGDEFRKVILPPDSPRGGMLTMASVLAVTSNPTRTSPVKRGLFILDNIMGAPAPPPPPDIPPLESAAVGLKNRKPTLREVLSAHRNKPECLSCHKRLDPPGLALENFNAMGLWREREFDQPIEPGGKLVTGESFTDIRGLKHILVTRHSTEFYRCLTEKLLTYALGRGLEDYDVEAVDQIVKRLEQDKGQFSSLLTGVIESVPFQKCRIVSVAEKTNSLKSTAPKSHLPDTKTRKRAAPLHKVNVAAKT